MRAVRGRGIEVWGDGRLRVAARWMLVVGALTYSSWPLTLLVHSRMGQGSAMASDYEAIGQPWAWLFRCADVMSGSAICAGAILGLGGGFGRGTSWAMRVLMLAAAVRGIATAVTGAIPTSCTSFANNCKALGRVGWHGDWQDVLHHQLSGYSGSAVELGLVALGAGLVLGGLGPAVRRGAPLLLALFLLHLGSDLGLFWDASRQGVPQRISEANESILFLCLGLDVGKPTSSARGWNRRARLSRS